MFGYGSPKVQALIQKLENADKCSSYIFKDFEKQAAAKRQKKTMPPKKHASHHHHHHQPQATKRFLPPPHRMPRPLPASNSYSRDMDGSDDAHKRRQRRQQLLEDKEKEITRQLHELHEKLQYLRDKESSRPAKKRKQHSSVDGSMRQQKRKRLNGDDNSDDDNSDEEDDDVSSGDEDNFGGRGSSGDEDEDGEEEDEDEDYEDVDDEDPEGRPKKRSSEVGEDRPISRGLGRGRAGGSGRGGRKRSAGSVRGSMSMRRHLGKQPKLPIVIGSLTVHKIGALPSGCSTKTLDSFHNEKYLWPVGYQSNREYTSVVDPKMKSNYTCEILLAKRRTGRGGRGSRRGGGGGGDNMDDHDDDEDEEGKSAYGDRKSRGEEKGSYDDDGENEDDFLITDPDDTDGDCFPLFRVTPADDADHPAIATSATGAWMQILRRINDRKMDGVNIFLILFLVLLVFSFLVFSVLVFFSFLCLFFQITRKSERTSQLADLITLASLTLSLPNSFKVTLKHLKL